jgi:tetratricopeptide (TPR) repeat protein
MNPSVQGQSTPADVFTPEFAPSPYPGLRPFEKSEWPIFFGRERMTDEVVNRLLERRLVFVHGASGSGKSSIVKAGVQARLEQQLARSGLRWLTCEMRPGSEPLANLTESFVRIVEGGASRRIDIRRTLNEGRQAPAALSKVLCLGAADRLCVLLDQFEELFRFAREVSQDESILLTDFLVGFEKNPPDGIYVLVTMRSEFLGDCARYDGLAETINRTQYLLPRMNTDDLLRAVRDPATLYGGRVTDRLAERLIADARGGQDELPLIQHGLSQLWSFASSKADNEFGPVVDLAAYETRGPLGWLLSEHADSVADAESADSLGKTFVENLFRSLSEMNVEGAAVRRPQMFKDLIAVTGAAADELRGILDRFRQPGISFITPYAPKQIEAETTIDISHEALIRCWRRIADKETGWLQQEFRDGLIWRSLVVQSEAFAANPKNFLSEATTEARGKWLTGRSEAWAKRYGNKWAEVGELLAASRREVDRQRQRDIATEAVNSLVFDVAQKLRDAVGVPAATVEEILNRARSLQDQLRAGGHSGTELILSEAAALNQTSRTSLTLGDTSRALEAASRAVTAYRELLRRNPDDSATLSGLSTTLSTGGDIQRAQGDLAAALDSYRESLAIAERLVNSDPDKPEWRRDFSATLGNIGDIQAAQGDLASALNSYRESLTTARRLAGSNARNSGSQRDLSIALVKIGRIQQAQGDLIGALNSYREGLEIARNLAASDPGNASWRRDLSIILGNIGDIQQAQRDFAGALASYRQSLAIADSLAKSDPGNAGWQRDLSVILGNIGDVQRAQGDLASALVSYRQSVTIAGRLAASDPGNASWQRDLSVSYRRIGDVEVAQGQLAQALDSYEAGLAIAERLAKADPGNASWQRDLSLSYRRIGDVEVEQRQLAQALDSYQAGFAIAERLAKADPSNAEWQRDLAVSDAKLASVYQAQKRREASLSEVVFRLFVSSPGDVVAERARAEAVVEKLNAEFRDRARFEAAFWEDHFYSGHETFQQPIPDAANCDLVLAIFRARLGSPLPSDFKRQANGEPYPSGTAYEVLTAIGKRRDGAPLPDIYVFRYPHDPLVSLDDPKRGEIKAQWTALKGFFERLLKTADGRFVAGFQSYDSPDDFAEQVENCLREWLKKNGFEAREVWDRARFGSPFPGLAAFDESREHIFFGRDLAIRQAIERLREAKTPFLLIVGASGAGKSSLLRAGLMPKLVRPGAIPEIDLFRPLVMTPGLDPFTELANALLAPEALGGELAGDRFVDTDALTEALRGDPNTAAGLIGEALDKAAEARREAAHFDKARAARLLLAVDQAERLFSEAPKDSDAFGELLRALAGSVAYILMVMRTDAYVRLQACAPLLALRNLGGTFDLLSPTPAELEDIVRRPVERCDPPLAFGPSDPPLPERLVADAKDGDTLPLLQMTLQGLYKAQEARGDGILSAEDYEGMAAAVTKAADAAMAHLGESGRKALEALVAALVADVVADPITGEPTPVVVALDHDAFVKGKPERRALVDAFVEARLLTLEGGGRVRPANDGLLSVWPEASALVREMTFLTRGRHALAPLAQAWAEAAPADKPTHLEISAPLVESGQQLEARFGEDLGEPLRPFIDATLNAEAAKRARNTRRRRLVIVASAIVAVAMAALAGWALSQRDEAVAQRAILIQTEEEAITQKATADRARNAYQDVLAVINDLAKSEPGNAQWQRDLSVSLNRLGDVQAAQGDLAGALKSYQQSLAIAERLAKSDPGNAGWQRDLAVSFGGIGGVYAAQKDTAKAREALESGRAIMAKLVSLSPENVKWKNDLARFDSQLAALDP